MKTENYTVIGDGRGGGNLMGRRHWPGKYYARRL